MFLITPETADLWFWGAMSCALLFAVMVIREVLIDLKNKKELQ